MYTFVLDMVTLMSLTTQPFDNFTRDTVVYSLAANMNFADLLKSQIEVPHKITYPEHVIPTAQAKRWLELTLWSEWIDRSIDVDD